MYLSSLARVGKQVEFEYLTVFKIYNPGLFPPNIKLYSAMLSIHLLKNEVGLVTQVKQNQSLNTQLNFIKLPFIFIMNPPFYKCRGCFLKFANAKWPF